MRRLTAETAPTILARIDKITDQSQPAWGRFTPSGMIAHLRLALCVSTGDIKVADERNLAMRLIVRLMLTIGFMPIPRGRTPTRPAFLSDALEAVQAEREAFAEALEAFTSALARQPNHRQLHPVFGRLTLRAWSKLHWAHFNHHLVQFGV